MMHRGCVHILVAQMQQTPSLQGISSRMDSGNSVPSHSAGFMSIPHELTPGMDFSSEMVIHVGRCASSPPFKIYKWVKLRI